MAGGQRTGGDDGARTAEAELSIGRVTSTTGQGHILFTLEDKVSRCIIVRAKVDMLAFSEALFGIGNRPCSVEVFAGSFEHLGDKLETKTVNVPCPVFGKFPSKEARKLEKDGWHAREDADFNGHRYDSKSKTYQVHLFRWVKQW